MDESQFDGIARALGATTARRGALGLLAALGAGGVVGSFGAFAKGKGKGKKKKGKKSGPKRPCPAKAKPDCAASACYAPSCDDRQGKWSCRNVCAGTSTPKCLGGQCVDACDEALGLTECGDQCCNSLVHSECCDGACCDLDQRCEDGLCVKSCEAWSDVPGGKLEYAITYQRRTEDDLWRIDQSASAVTELECFHNAVFGEVSCWNVRTSITGSHSMTMHIGDLVEREEGGGTEEIVGGTIPSLEIKLPESDEDPNTLEFTLATTSVPGTHWGIDGQSRADTFPIPDNWLTGWFDTDLESLPAQPRILSGVKEWSHPPGSFLSLARFTWTFTPDGC